LAPPNGLQLRVAPFQAPCQRKGGGVLLEGRGEADDAESGPVDSRDQVVEVAQYFLVADAVQVDFAETEVAQEVLGFLRKGVQHMPALRWRRRRMLAAKTASRRTCGPGDVPVSRTG
jgi:hypothetical protein